MKGIALNRAMYKKLKSIPKEKPLTHQQMKDYTGLDVNIRVMGSYLHRVDMMYDYELKAWRKKKPPQNPYQNTVDATRKLYEKYGIPFYKRNVYRKLKWTDEIRRIIQNLPGKPLR